MLDRHQADWEKIKELERQVQQAHFVSPHLTPLLY